MNPVSSVPIMEIDGRVYQQSYAILRHLSRRLGEYDGVNDNEQYWTDAMCDIGADCMYLRLGRPMLY